MNKSLSERDICTKCITPAILSAGWNIHTQIREEVTFTAGRIIVRGKLHTRKRLADNALVALTLLIAESKPEEKDTIVKVIVDLINRSND